MWKMKRKTSFACNTIFRIITLIGILLAFLKSQSQSETFAMASPSTYLTDIKNELKKEWPSNRTINIVFHGHSVPAGYFKTPTVNTLESYPHLVLKALKNIHPYAVVNTIVTAIGGENSINGAKRFERDVLSLKPDLILIDYALNDRGIEPEKVFTAWSDMIRMAKASGAKVILLTPSPDQRVDYLNLENKLKLLTNQIYSLAALHQIGLADSYQAFQFLYANKQALAEYMSQVNHPNRKGHELITAEIMKWFN
jgi:lysophospholipase L1-like esterase